MAGWSAPTARPPSSGHDRQEIEQVQEEPGEGERDEELRVDRFAGSPDSGRAEAAEDGPRHGDPGFPPGVVGQLLHAHHCAQERDEEWRRSGDALVSQLDHVS